MNGCLAWPKADPLPAAAGPATLAGGECDGFTFQWLARGVEGPDALRRLNPAFIRFTSGTTAIRKGVVLSHEATAARVEAADRVLRFTDEDRILWVLPLAYHFAVTIVAYVRAGAHILLCPDTFPARSSTRSGDWRKRVLCVAAPLRAHEQSRADRSAQPASGWRCRPARRSRRR